MTLAVTMLMYVAGCGFPPPDESASERLQPVFVLAVEGVTPPVVREPKTYQVGALRAIDPTDASVGQYMGLFLTVAAGDPDALQIRAVCGALGVSQMLQVVAAPTAEAGEDGLASAVAVDTVRDLLRAGQGVYWHVGEQTAGGTLGHRVAILLSEAMLGNGLRIELYTSVGPDGSPFGVDHIELVRRFFYMATLGDSVAWGNGLAERSKYATLVADTIEAETGVRVIDQMLAISGATIVPEEDDGICGLGCYRELPLVMSSVTTQVDLVEHPELVGLVLLDGCINDVGLTTILDPLREEAELIESTTHFCRDAMQALLDRVRMAMPQAVVVVTGYYPFLSEQSSLENLRAWITLQGLDVQKDAAKVLATLADNSRVFNETSRMSLAEAVAAVNVGLDVPAVLFVDPGFGPERAVFASETWLWGLTTALPTVDLQELNLDLFPDDPQFAVRLDVCMNDPRVDLSVGCIYTSVGHPSEAGARAYADAIIAALRTAGILPPSP